MDMTEEKSLTLKKPVKVGEQVIDQLTLKELTLAETGKVNKQADTFDKLALMISFSAGIPLLAAQQLCMSDAQAAGDIITSFLPDSPQTGDSSPQT